MRNAFVQGLDTVDTSIPAVELWKQNDNTTWLPQFANGEPIPTYITGILQDQIVPFAGSNYPAPAGYVGGEPYFKAGNSQNLVISLMGLGASPTQLAWCGIDAAQVPKQTANGTEMVTINHINGLPPVITLAAKAIESGTLINLPTIPNP
jgi:hypothetical protein